MSHVMYIYNSSRGTLFFSKAVPSEGKCVEGVCRLVTRKGESLNDEKSQGGGWWVDSCTPPLRVYGRELHISSIPCYWYVSGFKYTPGLPIVQILVSVYRQNYRNAK